MQQITLDHIIKSLLNEMGEESAHKYNQLLNIGKTGLRELNMDISGSAKIAVFGTTTGNGVDYQISENTLSAPLPDDYISYKRIGVCINNVMIPLGYNPRLCLDKMYDDCGGEEVRSSQVGSDVFLEYPLHYENGEMLGAYFGIGGGNNSMGYYRIDENFWRIQFGSLISGHPVVMEYLADVEKVNGQFVVHPYVAEALKAFIAWGYVRNRRGASVSEITLRRSEYYNQRRLSARRFTSFTLEEAAAYNRIGFKQTVKV